MKKKFIIKKMTCASCVNLNQNAIKNLPWIKQVSINLATNIANVEFDENIIGFSSIKKEIESNWFEVEEDIKVNKSIELEKKYFKLFLGSIIFSIPVFSMMFWDYMIWKTFLEVDIIMWIYSILSVIVVFIFWYHFHIWAFKSLFKWHFNMDSLVSLWTLTAFIYSIIAMFFDWYVVYFEAAVAIITLINLWKYLEAKAKAKAWDAISKLLELWVKKAYVLSGLKVIEKNIDDIKEWEVIVVKPGEKIALDWIILTWSANIDESMLTWESLPVYKEKWAECFGSTLNLDWNINVKVTKTNSNWTLANIIKMVEQAQSSKAPIEHLADKISGIFVPTIIIISFITFVSWYLLTGEISQSIVPAVAVLVIACPCALWLATPTAIMVWTWVWAKNGILIKNAETLEKTGKLDVIVFDKTWTLTNWKPEVTDIFNLTKEKENFISIAKSLSILSNHPLSNSISNYLEDIQILEVKNFEEIRWKWIIWEINWEKIKLGNKKLFIDFNEEVQNYIEKLTESWKTPIIIWNDNEIFGIIGLLDLPKIGVEETIKKIHEKGIKVIMLTWDTKKTAEFIWKSIGIDIIFSEVMPEDKLSVIMSLQNEWKKVAFVWDGINDAPALSQADLSIAMWTWSDIAIESSDIVLVKWNLEKVIQAIELSRETLFVIKQNLFWAFIYNIIWIPLAFLWLLNPIFASFAMSMSSVSVVSNSLRLKRFNSWKSSKKIILLIILFLSLIFWFLFFLKVNNQFIEEKVYVALEWEWKIKVINSTNRKVINTINLAEVKYWKKTLFMAHNVQVSPDGKSVWVTANLMKKEDDKRIVKNKISDQVIVIDPLTDKIIKRIPIDYDTHLAHIVVSSKNNKVYVSLQEKWELYIIDTLTYNIEEKINLWIWSWPHWLRLSSDDSKIFIALLEWKWFLIFDIISKNLEKIWFDSWVVQTAVSLNWKYSFWTLYNTKQILVYDNYLKDKKLIDLPKDSKWPVQIYSTPDSNYLFIADQGYYFDKEENNKVYRLNIEKWIIDQSIIVWKSPHWVVVDKNNKFVYITNLLSNDISIIDISLWKEVSKINVWKMPNGISIWNKNTWWTK